MKTILLVSELGGGLGHAAPLLAIADELRSELDSVDARIIFVSGDSAGYRLVFEDVPYPMINAPFLEPSIEFSSHSASYSEILATFGYSRSQTLKAALRSWDDLFETTCADLLIADHSPTACLAARGRIPVVQIGNGFTVPPADLKRFPSLKRGFAPPTVETPILNTVNKLLEERRQPKLQALPEFLDTEVRAIFTLPHIDPYAGIRKEPVLGTYHTGLEPLSMPAEPSLFFYTAPEVDVMQRVVTAANKNGFRQEAYLGPVPTSESRLLEKLGVIVHYKPPSVYETLANNSVLVSHGGSGLTAAAMIAGRPLVILPRFVESEITAQRIANLGLGIAVENNSDNELESAILSVTKDPQYYKSAQHMALQLQQSGLPDNPVGDVAKKVAQLILD
ncbi:MAG: nucleotide disphospho-sugar-binding domain-containing protein [Pseudomonadota bacterium]